MSEFFNSPIGFYVAMMVLNMITVGVSAVIHKGKAKTEDKAVELLPAEDAVKVNDILDVVERITESAVQDANSRIVIGLKKNNLFTKETADSIKQAVIQDVLTNLGPLQEKAIALLGPLENIIGQLVEKYVLEGKDQVTQLVQSR
jgi:hypothetical protein